LSKFCFQVFAGDGGEVFLPEQHYHWYLHWTFGIYAITRLSPVPTPGDISKELNLTYIMMNSLRRAIRTNYVVTSRSDIEIDMKMIRK